MKATLMLSFRVRPLAVFGWVMILFAHGSQPLQAEQPRVDANALGFSPTAAAAANVAALQRAVDGGDKLVTVTTPGVYDLDATVWLDNNTRLECSPGVVFRKASTYSFVLANRGIQTRQWNEGIAIDGLEIACNGQVALPPPGDPAFGLRGLVALFRVNDAAIIKFRCRDLATPHFALHICTFENLLVDGFEIRGNKDGVHLGPGKGFTIRNGVCQTGDDAIALNAQDYPSANPAQGDISDGVIENLLDEPREPGVAHPGSVSRLLTGAWVDWHPGIRLQNGDTVRHGKHVYRVLATFDTTQHESNTPPTHTAGAWKSPEGLTFVHNTADGVTRASIRNVVFRGIKSRARNGFMAAWEDHKYHRAVHPEVVPENLPVCEVTFEACSSDSPTRPSFISGNSNLSATLNDVTATGRLVGVTTAVHPVAVELTLDACRFEPDERAATLPDIELKGMVAGRLVLETIIENRPIRVVAPKTVAVEKAAPVP
jgi:hypothetical protein